jgi:hypothetical protein
MQLTCIGYHYQINGKNVWLNEKLDVMKFISKAEFLEAISAANEENPFDRMISKLAVHFCTRNRIDGEFVDIYYFRN